MCEAQIVLYLQSEYNSINYQLISTILHILHSLRLQILEKTHPASVLQCLPLSVCTCSTTQVTVCSYWLCFIQIAATGIALNLLFVSYLLYRLCKCTASCANCHLLLLSEDDSYVEHKEDWEEYVVCDKGILWRGNSRQPLATPWEYGQVRALCHV